MKPQVSRILEKLNKDYAKTLKSKLDQAEKDVNGSSTDIMDVIGKLEFSIAELYRDSYYLDDLYEEGKKAIAKDKEGLKALQKLDLDTSALLKRIKEISNETERAFNAAKDAKKLADQFSKALSGLPTGF